MCDCVASAQSFLHKQKQRKMTQNVPENAKHYIYTTTKHEEREREREREMNDTLINSWRNTQINEYKQAISRFLRIRLSAVEPVVGLMYPPAAEKNPSCLRGPRCHGKT